MNSTGKLIGIEIAGELESLWQKYPDGLTITNIANEMNLPYHYVHAAAVWICESKKAKWFHRPDRKARVIVPLTWDEPIYDLTPKQLAVFNAIQESAQNGLTQMSYLEIARNSETSPGSTVFHVESLERKGYIKIVSRGNHNTKTQIQITHTTQQ